MTRTAYRSERWRKGKVAGMDEEALLESFFKPVPMQVFSWEGEIDTIMTPMDSIRYYKRFPSSGDDVNGTPNWSC